MLVAEVVGVLTDVTVRVETGAVIVVEVEFETVFACAAVGADRNPNCWVAGSE